MSDKNIYENSSEIAQMVFAYDDLSIPSHLKSKLDLAIEYKRQKKYLEALEIYYKDLIPELPNHPVVLFSLAKLVLTFGHIGLAYYLFARVVNFEDKMWVNIYTIQAAEYFHIIDEGWKSTKDLTEVLLLRQRVSGQWADFSFELGAYLTNKLAIEKKFDNEYEYLKYIFENKKKGGFFNFLFTVVLGGLISILFG